MEILVVTWNYPPRRGGMESLLKDLCQALRKRHSVSVVTSYAGSNGSVEAEEKVYRPRWPGLAVFSLYALFRGALLLHRRKKIELIFGGSAMVAPLVLLLARLFGRKAIVQVHGLDLIYPNALYQFLSVRWIKHCDWIIANSRYTALLAEQRGVSRNTISVIAPGVDAELFVDRKPAETKKDELGLEGRKVILFVGRLARRKGVKEFIQYSLKTIISEVPAACLVIVGQNPTESLVHRDDLLGEIKAAVSGLRLENHVRLLGWLEGAELVKIYRACDLLILPALPTKDDVEGFGIVLLEAAAAGKPAVATRVGGIPDAIEDGKSGILVEAGDYQSLSRAIIRLLTDEKTRAAAGNYAKNRFDERFRWDKVVTRYEQAIHRTRL